ncbi:DUF5937 family protein [Streptomyces sp. NPDC005408]|uniref:ArsR/SmtB family transcription factor n=1 Tax=Streptomyces sp. NPDC005408 TaxID=3155341 RepID=UPI0033AFF3DC
MIEICLAPADLVRIRFARSPIQELVGSLHVLKDRKRQAMHRPWLAAARPRLAGLSLDLLPGLVGKRSYAADFLTPPPERLDTEFAEELERVRATTPDAVRDSLDQMLADGPLPDAIRELYDSPEGQLGRLVDEIRAYWQAAVEPAWPRLRAIIDADLRYRAQELTNGGVARLLSGLDPQIGHTADRLQIRTPNWALRKRLHGTGLLLVPCVFAWPQVVVLVCGPQQPMLTYSPRGIAKVWAHSPGATAEPLGLLVGRSRAALLTHLDLPLSTTQLAAAHGLTPATVSQHLSVLQRCGLVASHRVGRAVLYQRTTLATRLLDAQQ